MDVVKKLLMLCIREKAREGACTVTEAVIRAKAKTLHTDLIAQQPGTSHKEFKASHGWFDKSKLRSGIRSMVRHGEAVSSNLPAAEQFATELFTSSNFLEMQSGSEGKASAGLLFRELMCFQQPQVNKEKLSVMWRSNSMAWITCSLLMEWVNQVFGPTVKQHLAEKNLPLKPVLLRDNAPAHPPGLEEDLVEEFSFIQIIFLPPNTTPLIQPMDQ
ncbi:hypothetical protein JRQ81_016114 [Phrynocephalus forsythii]|uniref:HTH CENPB-type domain-containing protein n=1 Tax=Phrynocephalus forsythii TaxID=171643 RepID=A0A9Q0XW47_9SAUR|nr:hypothetical protein JRQ81_016114 [Phrynocephalus forsythii]